MARGQLVRLALALTVALAAAAAVTPAAAAKGGNKTAGYPDGAGVLELLDDVKPACPWGGYNVSGMPWVQPRDAVYQGDWYCNITGDFRSQVAKARNGSGVEFVLYGDSLTQCLRNWGNNCPGAVDWFNGAWGKQYKSVNWALGGDNPATLMWRLANGGSPEGTGAKLAFLMIGSNSLFDGVDYDKVKQETAEQIIENARYISSASPGTQVVVLGLLPKTGYENGSPTGKQTAKIAETNAWINKKLEEFADEDDGMTYAYCGDPFLLEDGETMNKAYMNDGLHPNGDGWAEIAKCLEPVFDKYLGNGSSSSGSSKAQAPSSSSSSSSGKGGGKKEDSASIAG